MTSSSDDLTKLIDSLREDAAKSIERVLSGKLRELEIFKEEAIQKAEEIVADKIRRFEEDSDSFENQQRYRWDETGLWVSAPPQHPPVIPPNVPPVCPVSLPLPPLPPVPPETSEPTSATPSSYGVRRASSTMGGMVEKKPEASISVAMPSLEEVRLVDKNQIKTQPVPEQRNKRKTGLSKSVFAMLLTLEFILGFGICYWWWSQWYKNQPIIELRPNSRGVFVSPESLRRFYDEIRSNHTFGKAENEWKSYEPNFRKIGSRVETKFSDDRSNIMVRVDDWIINIKFEHGKIVEKALLLFFEDKISVFKNDDYDNRLRIYLVDSIRFDGKPGLANTPSTPVSVMPPSESGQALSKVRPEVAQVGSGRAHARTISSFHRIFENSLNAHAPSKYVFPLNRQWKTLKTHYGLKNLTNLNEANCIFIVKGDGRELFRSVEVRDGKEHFLELNISGVDKLELIVDSNGSNKNDQAVWFTPVLIK